LSITGVLGGRSFLCLGFGLGFASAVAVAKVRRAAASRNVTRRLSGTT
jgi:hypothetical protein